MNAFEKWGVWVSSILTGATGIGYFWTRYLVENPDPFSVVNHPLEPWFLKAHILVSPVLVLALGSILVRHVWKHYRLRVVLGRRSGIWMAAVMLPMIASGYLIQAITDPARLVVASWGHTTLSVVFILALVVHQVVVQLRPRGGRAGGLGEADDTVIQAELLKARSRARAEVEVEADRGG